MLFRSKGEDGIYRVSSTKVKINVTDIGSGIDKAICDFNNGENTYGIIKGTTTVSQRGTYVITVTDKVGHKTEETLELVNAPNIKTEPNVVEGQVINTPVKVTVSEGSTLTVNGKVIEEGVIDIPAEERTAYEIIATDAYKNTDVLHFISDKDAPNAPIVTAEDVEYANATDGITVTVTLPEDAPEGSGNIKYRIGDRKSVV